MADRRGESQKWLTGRAQMIYKITVIIMGYLVVILCGYLIRLILKRYEKDVDVGGLKGADITMGVLIGGVT